MTHIGGYPGRYEARVGKILKEDPPTNGLFISGHSHILKVMPDKALGFLHINPGACGNEGWHKVKTLVRFSIEKKRIFDLQVIELGSRGIYRGNGEKLGWTMPGIAYFSKGKIQKVVVSAGIEPTSKV